MNKLGLLFYYRHSPIISLTNANLIIEYVAEPFSSTTISTIHPFRPLYMVSMLLNLPYLEPLLCKQKNLT